MQCCGPVELAPHEEDVRAMEVKLNELSRQGWMLKTIFDSPAESGTGLCTSSYTSQYVCCFYRSKDDSTPRKITLAEVKCTGTEYYRRINRGRKKGPKYVFDKREIGMEPVEQAINDAYARGARMATAVDVEGKKSQSQGCGVVSIECKFFLFFEEFEDSSLNVPHAAYVTLASRLRQYEFGCCVPPSQVYDTEIVRAAWETAADNGWHIAEMFNTGREKTHNRYRYAASTPAFRDSMLVFEAPVSALSDVQAGMANAGNVGGGFDTLEGGEDEAGEDEEED